MFASFFAIVRIVIAEEVLPVQISEFYANPPGDDNTQEWIELYNPTGSSIALDGWTIADLVGTSKTYALNGKTIDGGSFLVLERSQTGIALNNDQEQLVLRAPNGQEVKSALVTSIKESETFAFIDGIWQNAQPTKGLANLALVSPSPSPSASPTPSPSSAPTPQPSPTPSALPQDTSAQANIMLSEIQACGSGEWIEIVNRSDSEATLGDWRLSDGTTTISNLEGIKISPLSYFVIELPGYHLNNQGDLIRLEYGNEIRDQFAYASCAQGKTWTKFDAGQWEESACPTKGFENTPCAFAQVTVNQPGTTSVITQSSIPATPGASESTTPTQTPFTIKYALPHTALQVSEQDSTTQSGKVLAAANIQEKTFEGIDKKKNAFPPEIFLIIGGLLVIVSTGKNTWSFLRSWYNLRA